MEFRQEAERIVWRMYEDLREEEVNGAIKSLEAAYELGKTEEREKWVTFVNGTLELFKLTSKMCETLKDQK